MVLPKRERERERERESEHSCPIEREIIFTDFEHGDLRERERDLVIYICGKRKRHWWSEIQLSVGATYSGLLQKCHCSFLLKMKMPKSCFHFLYSNTLFWVLKRKANTNLHAKN